MLSPRGIFKASIFGDAEPSSYWHKVMGSGPVAYWPLWESAGTVANCLVDPAQDGTYSGALLANATGPDGAPCPWFDGVNDYVDVLTATLTAKWDAGGAQWSIMIWWKVNAAAVWADGAFRRQYQFQDSANDLASMYKTNVANTQGHVWTAGGTTESSTLTTSSTDWNCSVMTRDEAGDIITYYVNGAAFDTDTTIGVWASATPWSRCYIGIDSTAPNHPWHGWLAHCALWARSLSAPDVASLAAV